jgi:hypothetical protein
MPMSLRPVRGELPLDRVVSRRAPRVFCPGVLAGHLLKTRSILELRD